ncbi:MAG: protein kinase, partial [Candidatus Riflebacteria bacterium]|nr:protein kinase [Candidatus Riflebacteria bacterium]
MHDPFPPRCSSLFTARRLLATGGFGSVWLATQVSVDRPVVVKLLHRDCARDPEQVRRFGDEARITAALSHPNIVVLLDHDLENGVPWTSYEYLPGRNLRQILDEQGRLCWREALPIGIQVAQALEAAHAKGILHRDIKPENVIEAEPGHYKVADFGIAKWTGGTACKTATGVIVGTPGYVAPEQIEGAGASPRSDIYAWGMLMYELLTGSHPFSGRSPLELLEQQLKQTAPPPRQRVPDLPPRIDAIVAKALERDPARRFQRVDALRNDLEQLDRRPSGGRTARTIVAEGRVAAVKPGRLPEVATTVVRQARPRRVHWRVGIFGAVVLVLAIHFSTGTWPPGRAPVGTSGRPEGQPSTHVRAPASPRMAEPDPVAGLAATGPSRPASPPRPHASGEWEQAMASLLEARGETRRRKRSVENRNMAYQLASPFVAAEPLDVDPRRDRVKRGLVRLFAAYGRYAQARQAELWLFRGCTPGLLQLVRSLGRSRDLDNDLLDAHVEPFLKAQQQSQQGNPAYWACHGLAKLLRVSGSAGSPAGELALLESYELIFLGLAMALESDGTPDPAGIAEVSVAAAGPTHPLGARATASDDELWLLWRLLTLHGTMNRLEAAAGRVAFDPHAFLLSLRLRQLHRRDRQVSMTEGHELMAHELRSAIPPGIDGFWFTEEWQRSDPPRSGHETDQTAARFALRPVDRGLRLQPDRHPEMTLHPVQTMARLAADPGKLESAIDSLELGTALIQLQAALGKRAHAIAISTDIHDWIAGLEAQHGTSPGYWFARARASRLVKHPASETLGAYLKGLNVWFHVPPGAARLPPVAPSGRAGENRSISNAGR